MQGRNREYRLLNVLDFSSERKRMSVIMSDPDGRIRLFCKGADQVIMPLLGEEAKPELPSTKAQLMQFSMQGLRTLMVASRDLQPDKYYAWDAEYQATQVGGWVGNGAGLGVGEGGGGGGGELLP